MQVETFAEPCQAKGLVLSGGQHPKVYERLCTPVTLPVVGTGPWKSLNVAIFVGVKQLETFKLLPVCLTTLPYTAGGNFCTPPSMCS